MTSYQDNTIDLKDLNNQQISFEPETNCVRKQNTLFKVKGLKGVSNNNNDHSQKQTLSSNIKIHT